MSTQNEITVEPPSDSEMVNTKFEVPEVFQDEDADVWIKSNDGHAFKVYKAFLITASGYWKNTFLTVNASAEGTTCDSAIPWDEPASVITGLLYQIYPTAKPVQEAAEELILLIFAADKWLMDSVVVQLTSLLLTSRVLDARPMAIYTAVCRVPGLEGLKRAAARRLVQLYDPHDAVLRSDTAGLWTQDFLALYDLRRKRVAYCTKVFDDTFTYRCPHNFELIYGDWRRVLRESLTKTNSASCFASLAKLPGLLTFSCKCSQSSCGNNAWRMQVMETALSDDSRFIGDESYL